MEAKREFMREAIRVAEEAAREGDYAVGAVVVKEDEIISFGKTLLKHESDPSLHAEVVAIRAACNKLNSRFLEGCVLYSTHEPCSMCTSLAIWAKMKGVVFGASIEDGINYSKTKERSKFSWRQINIKCREILERGEPKVELIEEFMREECKKLFELSR